MSDTGLSHEGGGGESGGGTDDEGGNSELHVEIFRKEDEDGGCDNNQCNKIVRALRGRSQWKKKNEWKEGSLVFGFGIFAFAFGSTASNQPFSICSFISSFFASWN